MKIQLGNLTFPSKKATRDHIRMIVAEHEPGDILKDEYFSIISDLLNMHQESEQKIGVGVSHFTVEQNCYNTKGFTLHRLDGSYTDFSWVKCLNPVTQKYRVKEAMRRAINGHIVHFRKKQFQKGKVFCPYTKEELFMDSNTHVDHEAPLTFAFLSDTWLEKYGIDNIEISESTDNQYFHEMTNKRQKCDWQYFHMTKAKLRLLSKEGNLSHARKEVLDGV